LAKDYGEDLLVRIFDNGRATPYSLFVQAKAVRRIERYRNRAGDYIVYPVSTSHLSHWGRFWEPVILTVWDATNDVTYWECVQTALERGSRRGSRSRRGKTVSVRIPVSNVLNPEGVRRIQSRATTRFARFEREREGAHYLTEILRKQLDLDIEYDPQYGILTVPEGRFTATPELGPRVYYFGRAACDIERLARLAGISIQEAFEQSTGHLVNALNAVLRGETFVWKGPNGEVLDVWRNVKDVSADYYRMLDESEDQ
jgi:hypothetical protein